MSIKGLTAVIPVWGEYWRYLPALLQELARQGVDNERIVVVVNGEPAPSWLSVPSVQISVSSIGVARNAGLAVVESDYVVFCDADDLPAAGALSRLVNTLALAPDAILATGDVVREDGQPYPWPRLVAGPRWYRTVRQWAWNNLSLTTGTVFRTEALRALGGWPDMHLAEDGALGCILAPHRAVHLGIPTRIYRVHASGLCQQGHSSARWRQAYREQREYIAHHVAAHRFALPGLGRLLPLYAMAHSLLSIRLSRLARHTT